MLVSVIVNNYNYESYVGATIDSALNLDWPEIEVIVVDDGSTDRSAEIIRGYGDRITTVFQPNSGQVAACNAGYVRSKGEMVVFLDSDDLLRPSLIREVAAVWRSGLSKVQVQMEIIDGEGKLTGSLFPQYSVTPTCQRIRDWYLGTGAYPSPPGSGNIYARPYLEKIFPLDESCGKASDSICLAVAPLLGDVETIVKPLVAYRVHGRNQGAMNKMEVTRFAREAVRAEQRFAYAQRVAKRIGVDLPDSSLNKGLSYLLYRLASKKLTPEIHPIINDSLGAIVRDVAIASFARQGYGRRAKIVFAGWSFMVAVLPRPAAAFLIRMRFVPALRPKILTWLFERLKLTEKNGTASS